MDAVARGLYTQGAAVLLSEPIDFARIEPAVSGFQKLGLQTSPDGSEHPLLLLDDDQPGGGQAIVVLSDQPWPDSMGTPEEAPELFMAWSLGQFGPLTYPDCLQRAMEQSWRWDEGAEEASKHVAHVRVLYSYVLGSEDIDSLTDTEGTPSFIPTDADGVDELNYITRVISRLLELPEAICYFNPGGEVLMNAEDLRAGLNDCWQHELIPVDAWTNVRLFRASETWTLMDTVGNEQFDLPDLEVIFENDQFDPSDVESFLRNVVLCLLMDDIEINDGDTADGPGEQDWQAVLCHDGLNDPPRPTIRWFPATSQPPEDLLDPGQEPQDDLEIERILDLENLLTDDEEAGDEEDDDEPEEEPTL